MKIGIIGFGSMGRMLANGIMSSEIIPQEDIYVSTRTVNKVESFFEQYPRINVCNNVDVATKCDSVFICTPPNLVKQVLLDIREYITDNTHIISIAAYVSLENIESIIRGKVSKVIPSFVSEVNEGVFLVCHNSKVTNSNKEKLCTIIGKLGKIYEINENQFEVYTDITSCSPGIFSAVFSEFIKSACRHGDVDYEKSLEMFIQTLYGLTKIYKEKQIGLPETIQRVARKGGITEIGISVVNDKAPSLFDEIFDKTLAKHEMRKLECREEFS